DAEHDYWASFEAEGWKDVGAVGIVSIEATDYEGDPFEKDITGHRVHLRVCLDNSSVDTVDKEGEPVFPDLADRVVMKVEMKGQPRGIWSMDKFESVDGKTC